MSVQMPITWGKVKNHFHYHLWQYILLVLLSVLLWNLLYTTTRYRTPDDQKLEFYAEGYQTNENMEAMDKLIAEIWQEVLPELEEVSYTFLTLDETYGPVQLTVWASAGQGDVYLLSKERFRQLAQGGAMVNLQPYVDSGILEVEGMSLASGIVREDTTGESMLCGIPADALVGLEKYGLLTQGGIVSILSAGGNEEESVLVLNYFLTHMRQADQ